MGKEAQTVISPEAAPMAFRGHYTQEYENTKHDSPDRSRIAMVSFVKDIVAGIPASSRVLEVGAGRQPVMKQFVTSYGDPEKNIVTMDISRLKKHKLLVSHDDKYPNVSHVEANAQTLPFQDGSFDGLFSNMAADLAGKAALGEFNRVLKDGSEAVFNFHHPALIPDDLEAAMQAKRLTKKQKERYQLWKFMKDHDIIYKNKEEIVENFGRFGFEVNVVEERTDGIDTWWEVKAVKQKDVKLSPKVTDQINSIFDELDKREQSANPFHKVLAEAEAAAAANVQQQGEIFSADREKELQVEEMRRRQEQFARERDEAWVFDSKMQKKKAFYIGTPDKPGVIDEVLKGVFTKEDELWLEEEANINKMRRQQMYDNMNI